MIAVVQPHRYSRLHDLFEEFCGCFNDADGVIVADVYPAGEASIEGAEQATPWWRACAASATATSPPLDSPAERCRRRCASRPRPGDLVVCLGAGDITSLGLRPAQANSRRWGERCLYLLPCAAGEVARRAAT